MFGNFFCGWKFVGVLVFVAFAPIIGLLLRGLVWGADSFAFWALACGQTQWANNLSSHFWFTNIVPFFGCNFFLLLLVMFFFNLLWVLGLFLVGKHFFLEDNRVILFVLSVVGLTPLIFLEMLRFENQFFSLALAFLVLGIGLTIDKWYYKKTLTILTSIIAFISLSLWSASFLVMFPIVFKFLKNNRQIILVSLTGFLIGTIIFWKYALFSFTQLITQPNNLIAEEIPIIGLIFIIHIITFIKFTPKKFLPYTIILLVIGLIKVKYIFLCVPFLIIGLLEKDKQKGIYFRGDKIPLLPLTILGIIGLTIMVPFLYPTTTDIQEMEQAIILANENNLPLKNDWGVGWVFVSLGHETKHKRSSGNAPDWNSFPYVAYTNKNLEQEFGCSRISDKIFICPT